MNEINALIWPNKLGIGIMDPKAFSRTAAIAQQFGIIKNAPSGAYRTDLAKAAVAQLKAQGVDVFGGAVRPPTLEELPLAGIAPGLCDDDGEEVPEEEAEEVALASRSTRLTCATLARSTP